GRRRLIGELGDGRAQALRVAHGADGAQGGAERADLGCEVGGHGCKGTRTGAAGSWGRGLPSGRPPALRGRRVQVVVVWRTDTPRYSGAATPSRTAWASGA